MTADELLRALKALEPSLRALRSSKSIDGLIFELEGGAVLKVPTKGALRSKKHREKRHENRDERDGRPSKSVTKTVTNVTVEPPIQAEGVPSAAPDISSKDLKTVGDSGSDRSPHAGASLAPPPAPVQYDTERETLLSPDFEFHPAAVAECAAYYKVSESVIRAAVEEFKTYWVIGGGAGKRRSNWQAQCRKDLARKRDSGKLAALAAAERSSQAKADASKIAAQVEASRRRADRERLERRELATGGVRRSEPPPPPKDQAGAVLALIRGIG